MGLFILPTIVVEIKIRTNFSRFAIRNYGGRRTTVSFVEQSPFYLPLAQTKRIQSSRRELGLFANRATELVEDERNRRKDTRNTANERSSAAHAELVEHKLRVQRRRSPSRR